MFPLRVATRADLPELVKLVSEPFSTGSLDTADLTFNADLLLLKIRSALSELTVWPDTQTAEVHTRFEAASNAVKQSVDQASATMVFFYLSPEFQGVGIGSQMLANVRGKVRELNKRGLLFTAIFRDKDVSFGILSGMNNVKDAGKLKVLESVFFPLRLVRQTQQP
ncbi:hypothetical protein EJ07DRAFT_152882 [Lizonia empirigonia]|nr:hypothetical protein EJ07DRAFT_152882 [Lizonia empirigonia]